jgi:membrane-associated phospholipid phosphatase
MDEVVDKNWRIDSLRAVANGFSLLFHPIFLITYFLLLMLIINPFLFGASTIKDTGLIIIYVVAISIVFPLIPVIMMYGLGMSKSLQMKSRTERTIPLVLTGIFYLWLYINMFNNQSIPLAFNVFLLGSVITLFTCFFVNLFTKISLHTAGIAGLFTGFCWFRYHYSYDTFLLKINSDLIYNINTNLILVILLIIAGLIGTSRLILKAHFPSDIYGGYLVGFAAQIISMRILIY